MYENISQLTPILQRVEILLADHSHIVLAIDGMSAAGKTTAALDLSQRLDAPVVHMDDFFLPPALRTADRLTQPGGNIHYERFAQEVLPALREGKGFSFRRFQCSTMTMGDVCSIPAAPVVITEGAYALHPYFGDYAHLALFLQIDPTAQRQRILSRSSPEIWEDFRTRWIPMENTYHQAFSIPTRVDLIL
jgi:uridine kinase